MYWRINASVSSQNFSPRGWRSGWWPHGHRKYGTTVTYSSTPTAFLLLQIAPLLSHFAVVLPSRNFFLLSFLETDSTPFLSPSRGKIWGAGILWKIIEGILEVSSSPFFFFLPLLRNHSLAWEKKYFPPSLWFSRGRRMIKKKKKKKGGRGWRRVVNRKDEKGGENMRW